MTRQENYLIRLETPNFLRRLVWKTLEQLDEGVNPIEYLQNAELHDDLCINEKIVGIRVMKLSPNLIKEVVKEFYANYW